MLGLGVETIQLSVLIILRVNNMFKVNQIVKGKKAGTFVILGFRIINDEHYAQLKSVHPDDYTKVAVGELSLPVSSLQAVN